MAHYEVSEEYGDDLHDLKKDSKIILKNKSYPKVCEYVLDNGNDADTYQELGIMAGSITVTNLRAQDCFIKNGALDNIVDFVKEN